MAVCQSERYRCLAVLVSSYKEWLSTRQIEPLHYLVANLKPVGVCVNSASRTF